MKNIFKNIGYFAKAITQTDSSKTISISLTDAAIRSSSLFGPLVPSYFIEQRTHLGSLKQRISKRI